MALAWVWNAAPQARAVQPGYLPARAFGYQLQHDFATDKSKVISGHIDQDAMWRRICAPFGPEALADASTQKIFGTQFLPSLVHELAAFDSYQTMILSRVMLIEGARYLELILIDKAGAFQILRLRLSQQADGAIGISDLRMHGVPMEYTHIISDSLIVAGMPTTGILPDEEMTLSMGMGRIRTISTQLIREMGSGSMSDAFALWSLAPDDVRHTRFWRYLRLRLVSLGSAPALKSLQDAIADGSETDPLIGLSYSQEAQMPEGRLRLLDRALRTEQEMPFLRAAKAGVLLEMGRDREALDLARDICELTPFNGAAYLIALRASVALDDMAGAMTALRQWGLVLPASTIEPLLKATPQLAAFLASKDYREWRQTAVTAQQPGPEPPPAVHG